MAVLDHRCSLGLIVEKLYDAFGQLVLVMGRDIDAAGTSAFLKATAGGGNDGQTALHGFDDRNAETFIKRGEDEDGGTLIEGGELGRSPW